MNEEKPKVFISYSWEDKTTSRKLADCLRLDGAQVWIDYSENKAGDSFIKKMNSGLEWCDTFVLLWSKSAANSNFVSLEWEGALANNLKIIPCLLDKTKLPFILSGRIYKDLSNFNEGYNSLAKDLNLVTKEEKTKEFKKIDKTPPITEFTKQEIAKPKPSIFRSNAQALSEGDVKSILKKFDFFCTEHDWNKGYCNPNGKGFANDFVLEKNDRVAYDQNSGLTWQLSGSDVRMDYKRGKKWIKELNKNRFAGVNYWRLPTLEEAMSLIEPEQKNDRYINNIFDSKQFWIWTADQVIDKSSAWVVNFSSGSCHGYTIDGPNFVRAVFSGQSATAD